MSRKYAGRRKTAIYWPYEPSWDYDPDLEMWSAETDDGFLLMINKYWDGYEQDGYEMQIDYPSGSTGIYWGNNEMKLMEQADYILNQYRGRGVDAVTSRKANIRKGANTFTLDMMEVRSRTYDGDAALYGLTFPNIHLDLDANFEIFSNYWEGRSKWEWAVFWNYGCIYVSDRTFSTPEQALDNFINGEGLYPRYTKGFENVINKIHDYMNGRVASRKRRAKKARRNRKVATDVRSLTRDQLIELKQKMLIDRVDYASWNELLAADYLISDEEVYSEFDGVSFTDDDFFCTVKKARRANMRKRAYGYWESMEFNSDGDEVVEFRDIVPVDVLEGKGEHSDGVYPFDAQLFIDDVTWDEYDENESYTWGFIIYEDGSYEWGDYYATFTGCEWDAQSWADDIIQKFVDDYESGRVIPENMDYYLTFLD